MDAEKLPVLLRDEGMAAVRAYKAERRGDNLAGDKGLPTDFALELPIAAIKIDREFISDIAANEYSRAITRMVLNITKELKLLSISEGIETKEQLQILQEMGCDVIQGYLIGRSVKEDAALEMLRNFKPEI